MRRWLRYFRIAFSVMCGIACVLLIALWVRSYWWMDEITYVHSPAKIIVVVSVEGLNGVRIGPWQFTGAPRSMIQSYWKPRVVYDDNSFLGFRFKATPTTKTAAVPYWFSVLLFGSLAVAPWFRWRFSLRTLLIATTLVAVVLGLIVYAIQ
jgi:hypothetical protein